MCDNASGKTADLRKRIPWIDVSRGLAFLMVIYSHIPQCDDTVMLYFSPVFLTTFFFVSGYLFKSGNSFSMVLEQRLRTLIIPFVILGVALIAMTGIVSFNEASDIPGDLKNLFSQTKAGGHATLWFIAALFVYSMLFYFVDLWCKTSRQLAVTAVCLLILNCISLHLLRIDLPWHLSTFGFGCFYMALGRLYRQYEEKIDGFVKGWMVMLALLIYVGYISYSKRYISWYGSTSIIDAMIVTLAGLLLIIVISKKWLGRSRLLLFVGSNSLLYFALHGKAYSLLLTMGAKFMPGIFGSEDFFVKGCIALSVVLLDALILIPPTVFVNRYVPQILGRKFKIWKAV